MIAGVQRIIEKYFKEKGYYNISVKVLQRDDPERPNFVYWMRRSNGRIKSRSAMCLSPETKKVRDSKLKGAMKKTKEKSLRNFFKSAKYIQESYEDDKYTCSINITNSVTGMPLLSPTALYRKVRNG